MRSPAAVVVFLCSSGFCAAQAPTWTTKAPLPTSRIGFAVGVVDGILYAVGGIDSTGVLARVDAYNPATDSWSGKAPMPTQRCNLAVAVVDGILYAIGGSPTGNRPTNAFEAYDPRSDTWSVKAPMPTARDSFGAGAIDGIIYAVGGMNNGPLNTVEAYDPKTGIWYGRAPMHHSRISHGVAVVGGILYAFGGGLTADVRSLEAYDPVFNRWTDRARPPSDRSSFAVGVVNNTLYAVGGLRSQGVIENIDAYTPALDRWTTVARSPTARVSPGVAGSSGVLYVLGGWVSRPGYGAREVALNEALDFHIVPAVSPRGIVNAASFRAPEEPGGALAPGAIVAIFGNNLADEIVKARAAPLPNSLGGTTVTIDGRAAPLFFVSPGQVNAQVPFETQTGTVRVAVARPNATTEQLVAVNDVSPGIFLVGDGLGAVLDAETYELINDAHPARPGGYLAIWCTGLGRLVPPVRTGFAPELPPSETAIRPDATIGGVAAGVLFSGAAPGLAGANQVNVQVPASLPPGRHMLVISMNGVDSNAVPIVVGGT